jgi:hypothetical protein
VHAFQGGPDDGLIDEEAREESQIEGLCIGELLRLAQLDPRVQFRHTFASTMLSRNAPLLYVQQQGEWRSASRATEPAAVADSQAR